jgi:uncharacterized protein (TIGR03086 family)
MRRELVIDRAGAPTIEVVGNIATDQPDAPTPCVNYSVRQLIDHLLFWAPSLAAAARKEAVPPPAVSDIDIDLTDGDWSAKLEADLSRLVTAWSDPAAWEGATGRARQEVPATMIGGMVCVELVVHGSDLARATDQKPEWEEDVVAFVHRELRTTPIWGGQMGAYGPEVPVDDEASTLARALDLSRRDPAWSGTAWSPAR